MASGGDITHEEAKSVVDDLVRLIEQNFTAFKIHNIYKAGSLGHGTAVFGDFDVDLVIYSDSVKAEQIAASGYSYYLKPLDTFLQTYLGTSYVQSEKEKRALLKGRSIQFTYRGKIEVDLLVSPNWRDRIDLYRFLGSVRPEDRNKYTVFASKWQIEFFKHRPPEVKEYIRKAKAWRNKMWPIETGGAGKPSSYLMSLLVLRAWQTKGYGTSSINIRITDTLKKIVLGSPNIYWDTFYEHGDYPRLEPPCPRVIDPANPANNVWITGFNNYQPGERICDYEPGDGNASLLRQYIHTIDLSRPDGMARNQF